MPMPGMVGCGNLEIQASNDAQCARLLPGNFIGLNICSRIDKFMQPEKSELN
jgi:hypothetical protein